MTSRADSLTHEDLMKAMEEADVVKKELGIGASTESRINKVVANQYQYATPGDSKAFIDEIERLRAALAEAREVMKPFALQANSYGQEPADYVPLDCADYINVGNLRRAAQWLERNP